MESSPVNPAASRAIPDPRTRRLSLFDFSRILFGRAYRRADDALDRGQTRAFRFLWLFLPALSIAAEHRFQAVLVSRILSDAGQQALAYGVLVALVRGGGSAFDAALLGVATLVPPTLLGFYGGAVADALPKRLALGGIYVLQALLCLAAPSVIGTDLAAMMLLLFAVNTLGQVSGPSEPAVIPLVATEAQLASAASLLSLASSMGTAFGTALLAPILVRAFGVETVIYVAAGLLFLAATRTLDFQPQHAEPDGQLRLSLLRSRASVRPTIEWLVSQPAIATMVFLAAIAGTVQVVIQTLAPRYVQDVLHVDPADAVYVFAPSALGLLLALYFIPRLVRRQGERNTALLGFALMAISLVSLGLVGHLGWIDGVNPLRALSFIGLELGERLRTAAFLALPLGFGIALATTSVHIYINRRVPLSHQGRTFALQSTIKNGGAILPLTTLGLAAGVFGIQNVLLASPFVLLALAVGLVQLSRRFGGHTPRGRLDVLSTFWEADLPAASLDEPSIPPKPASELA
ncbi:MAG: MFS transporter [Dehalococcoidia bacterium]|nr:MFS transporter [Dehalococcoidia bacterium]